MKISNDAQKYSEYAARLNRAVMAVYGLLLIASKLLMTGLARLHTYIRPL